MQRFLAVRMPIAPEGLERNSDQIRSSILVLKGTRSKKNAGNQASASRNNDAVPRLGYAPRRSNRCAVRLAAHSPHRPSPRMRRAHPTAQLPAVGGRRSAGETRSVARWFLSFSRADVKTPEFRTVSVSVRTEVFPNFDRPPWKKKGVKA